MKKTLLKAATFVGSTVIVGLAATGNAAAVSVFTGSGANNATAYQNWLDSLSGPALIDNLTTLSGNTSTQTSGAGNSFTANGSNLFSSSFSSFGNVPAGQSGRSLSVGRRAAAGGFTWNLANPSNAFSFFGYDNDRGTITVSFVDGGTQSFNYVSTGGSGVTDFFGISGLNSLISSVSVLTTDPGGGSVWDNFATGSSATATPVPTPAAVLPGLFGMGMAAIRKRKEAATEEA